MPEKFLDNLNHAEQSEEYDDLLQRAKQGVDTLSNEERERLFQFGHYCLAVDKNAYQAKKVFKALHDFEGLRKTADYLLRESP